MIHYQKEIGFNFCYKSTSSGNIVHAVYLSTEHRVYFVRLYLLNKQKYFNEKTMSTCYNKGLNVYKISRLTCKLFFQTMRKVWIQFRPSILPKPESVK